MKIGIIGYGKMGKAIEKVAIDRGHLIIFKTNKCDLNLINDLDVEDFLEYSNLEDLNDDYLLKNNINLINDVDVTIEFSTPESAFTNIKNCIDTNVPVVSGTTGWLEDLDDIKKLCDKKNGSFLYASNFSLGANLFFELNKKLAHLMSDKSQYKTSIDETHHIHKVDKPSGTAITLADDIISNLDDYYTDYFNKN